MQNFQNLKINVKGWMWEMTKIEKGREKNEIRNFQLKLKLKFASNSGTKKMRKRKIERVRNQRDNKF